MICEDCGGHMEMVDDREVELPDEGLIVVLIYECTNCGLALETYDA